MGFFKNFITFFREVMEYERIVDEAENDLWNCTRKEGVSLTPKEYEDLREKYIAFHKKKAQYEK